MILNTFKSKIPMAPNKFNYKVRIVSEPCPENGELYSKYQLGLLKMIAEDPVLSCCKDKPFAKMTMHHDGTHWQIIVERIIEE